MGQGILYGVGCGPGDPELMTMKAVRVLRETRLVAFFAKRGKAGNGRTIAEHYVRSDAELIPLYYPYTVELSPRHPEYVQAMRAFYEESAAQLSERLSTGEDVAVLCEGDPLFYGSYMYLHDRLAKRYSCQVIPGITSFSGCAARKGMPLVSTDRTFSIIPGTLPEARLEAKLREADGAAIIKLGSNFAKVKRVLQRLGRVEQAMYFERGTMVDELAIPLREKQDDKAIYFSLILVPDHDGGPYRELEGEAP